MQAPAQWVWRGGTTGKSQKAVETQNSIITAYQKRTKKASWDAD
jgi:hypothetical protein